MAKKEQEQPRKDSVDESITDIREDGALSDAFSQIGQNKNAIVIGGMLDRKQRDNLYRQSTIIRKTVSLKPTDATKHLPQWTTTEGDIDQLRADYQDITAIGQPLEELTPQSAIAKAGIYGNHDGDGFIFLGVNDGLPENEPVDETKVKSVDWMAVKSRYEIGLDYIRQGYRVYFDSYANLPTTERFFHKSRVIRIPGIKLHGDMLSCNSGYNDSVLQSVYRQYHKYCRSVESGADMVDSHSIFKYKLKGLRELIKQKKRSTLESRFSTIIQGLGSIGGLIFDADTEDADFISRTYGGIDGLLKVVETYLLAAADMPRGKIFGNAATAALSEAGTSERADWNEKIEAYQHNRLLVAHTKITRYLLLAQGVKNPRFGISYKPHYPLSEKELANIKKVNAETDKIYIEAADLDKTKVLETRFGGSEYGHELTLG